MEEILKSLAAGGVPGAILAFILWRIAPVVSAFQHEVCSKLERLSEAFDRSTKADMIRLIASPNVSPAVKEAAAEQIKDCNTAQDVRDKDDEQKLQQSKTK